jgi:hypothetical protein
MRHLEGFEVLERSRKNNGFDYWLGSDERLFQNKVRLEASGIRKGNRRRQTARLLAKLRQTEVSASLSLPARAIVVEFSEPSAAPLTWHSTTGLQKATLRNLTTNSTQDCGRDTPTMTK